MKKRHWPNVSTDYPDSILDHAGCLHDDLEAINTFARESQSSGVINSKLPHTLKNEIFSGITSGIQEALSNDVLPKELSVKQQARLRDTIGRHITEKAGYKARDRVPLSVFSSLLDSYSELLIKLWDSPALRQQPPKSIPISLSDLTTRGESESQSELPDNETSEVLSREGSKTGPDARNIVEYPKKTGRGQTIVMGSTGTFHGDFKKTGSKDQEGEGWESGEEGCHEDSSNDVDYDEHEDSTEEEGEKGKSDQSHNQDQREQAETDEEQAPRTKQGASDTPRENRRNVRKPFEENLILQRCTRCQSLDHSRTVCNAPFKCAKCARPHKTRNCRSKILKCANCDGPHGAFSVDCPARNAGYSKTDDFKSQENVGSAIQHESIAMSGCSIDQDLPLRTSVSVPLSLHAVAENVQPEPNFKNEENFVDRSTECSISAGDVDSLPLYQPTEIKVEPRALPRPRDQLNPPPALQDLEQKLLDMNAALSKLQRQMGSYKRSSSDAFPDPESSKVGGNVKRIRQDVDYTASPRDVLYPDYYRP